MRICLHIFYLNAGHHSRSSHAAALQPSVRQEQSLNRSLSYALLRPIATCSQAISRLPKRDMFTDKAGSGKFPTDSEVNTPRVSQQTNYSSSSPARREGQRPNPRDSRRQKTKPQKKAANVDEQKKERPKHPRPTHCRLQLIFVSATLI
jgi:hypothetical protein